MISPVDIKTRTSSRKKRKIDYVALNEGDGKRIVDQHFHTEAFITEFNNQLVAAENEYISLKQLSAYNSDISSLKPGKIRASDVAMTGMNVKIRTSTKTVRENSDIEFDQLCAILGWDTKIPVMDVLTQENETWTIKQWFDYYTQFENKRLKNVISLEIGSKEISLDNNNNGNSIGFEIQRPEIVCHNDILDKVWKYNDNDRIAKPSIQKYCLTGVKGCYTDFHVDFAGTNVYYNVLRGEKWFLLYPMNDHNLNEYKKWCDSNLQNEIFLGGTLTEGQSFKIHEGELFLIPTGYIHAVYTPKNSYVIGGNYLTLGNLIKHIDVNKLEYDLNVPKKFRFPEFDRVIAFIVEYVLDNPAVGNPELCKHLIDYLESPDMTIKGITKKKIKTIVQSLKDL